MGVLNSWVMLLIKSFFISESFLINISPVGLNHLMTDRAVLLLGPLILFEKLKMNCFPENEQTNEQYAQVNQGGPNQYIPLQ